MTLEISLHYVMCVSYKCVQVMYQLGVQEHEQCAVSEYREFIHGAHWYIHVECGKHNINRGIVNFSSHILLCCFVFDVQMVCVCVCLYAGLPCKVFCWYMPNQCTSSSIAAIWYRCVVKFWYMRVHGPL